MLFLLGHFLSRRNLIRFRKRTTALRLFNSFGAKMGIHQLSKVLDENAPSCMKENDIKNYFGRKIAIDASMSIYQFLIAVRSDGNQLTNEQGETTSHLMGMFYRTIRMVDNGIKPVYVFDGKPPEMKSGELAKRSERRAEAQKQLDDATETGDTENVEKFSRRLVRVTAAHNEACKKLLGLMGIPYIDAPCEAEAQCAELVKGGKVYATATEDMDSLTFGSSVVLRHLTFSEARKMPIQEYHLPRILTDLELSQDEFIDLCILLGCDYCDSIKGIGPKKAIGLIKQHKTIEQVIKHLDTSKYPLPDEWKYKESRELFQKPEVRSAAEIELKWSDPNEEEIVKFMCEENGFNEDRIRNAVKKLTKARHTSTQGRLDNFFKVMPSATPPTKRKNDKASKGPAAKKAKASGGKFKKR